MGETSKRGHFIRQVSRQRQSNIRDFLEQNELSHCSFSKLGFMSERWQLFLCRVIHYQPGLTALFFLSGEVSRV